MNRLHRPWSRHLHQYPEPVAMLQEGWLIAVGCIRRPDDRACSLGWRIASRNPLRQVVRSPTPNHVSMSFWCDCAQLTYLHNGATAPAGHDNSLFFLEYDSPDSLGRATQLSYGNTSLEIPDLDATIAATADYPGVVKL
jgi:hypothetical protein